MILGNRAMMMDYGIKVPSQEYEQHYTLNQRRIVYMAVAGKLYAMFRIAYQSDPKIAADLELVHRTGMYLVVDCDDFNCDVRLLETAYGLPTGSVKVLSGAEHEAVAPAVAWLPRVRAVCCIWAASAVWSAAWSLPQGPPRARSTLLRADPLGAGQHRGGCADDADRRHCRAAADRHCAVSAAWLVITLFFPLMQR